MKLRIAKLIWAIHDLNAKANDKLEEFGCYIYDGKNWKTKHDPQPRQNNAMIDLLCRAFYWGIILTTVVAWVGITLIVIWEIIEWLKRK